MENTLDNEFSMSSFEDDVLMTELDSFMDSSNEEIEETEIEETNNNINEQDNEELDKTDEVEQAEEVVDNPDEGAPSEDTPFSLLATALVQEGVLPSLSLDKVKDFKSFDDIAEAIKNEIKNNELAGLTDTQKKYLKALEAGISEEDFIKNEKEKSSLNNITEDVLSEPDNEDLRKSLIIQDLLEQGINKEKAEKLAQRSIDLGEDVDDAKEALKLIKERKQIEEETRIKTLEETKKQREKENKEALETLKTKLLKETKHIIEGLPYSPTIAEKVYDSITKPVKIENGKAISKIMEARSKDPVDFEIKLNYLFEITDGFNNFDKLIKVSKSNAVDKLSKSINANTFNGLGNSPNNSGNKFADELEKFFK